MIIVTGAAGFIGLRIASALLESKAKVIAVHRKTEYERFRLASVKPHGTMLAMDLPLWLKSTYEASWLDKNIDGIIHFGAITDTTCTDQSLLKEMNVEYSKSLWDWCASHGKPFVYASSGATYGTGEKGFVEDENIEAYEPLNLYAKSKQEFDLWALKQEPKPPFWAGIKPFNVYGENEEHKGKMASMVYRACKQVAETGSMRLFKNGEQQRDFIYVGDIVKIVLHMLNKKPQSGLYNAGTGIARSFNDMARLIFKSFGKPESIEYFDMPEYLLPCYQSFTKADTSKLEKVGGFSEPFMCLEDGIELVAKRMAVK